MADRNRQEKPPIQKSEQKTLNWSFDEEYKVLATELLAEYSGTLQRLQTDASGNLKVTSTGSSSGGKATDAYAISNEEDTGTYEYYGFEDADGNWYILRITSATGIYLYAAGSSAYSTAWTNRASQTYASYGSTF